MEEEDEDNDGVEEEVFNYLELRDLCNDRPHETFFEHYHLHHAEVLEDDTDENTDDTDAYGEGLEDDDCIGIDTKYQQARQENYEERQQEKETIYGHKKSSPITTHTWNTTIYNRLWTANAREKTETDKTQTTATTTF